LVKINESVPGITREKLFEYGKTRLSLFEKLAVCQVLTKQFLDQPETAALVSQ
jgi:hypothetical protein